MKIVGSYIGAHDVGFSLIEEDAIFLVHDHAAFFSETTKALG